MATILVVDDDKNFLLSLADGLKSYDKKFKVLTAENGKDAVDSLRENKLDLVITDLKMPEMDGFDLLAHMVPNYPSIPVIVITAFATREMEDDLLNMGTFKFMEKPLEFNALVEKIYEGLEVGSHHFTKVLSLCSFLRMIEAEKKTCTITIQAEGRKGFLYYFTGILIDGETENDTGARAVYDIVTWEAAEVELDGLVDKEARKFDMPLNYIVKEEYARMAQEEKTKQNPSKKKSKGTVKKEIKMNEAKLDEAMEILKTDLGDGLVGSSIVSRAVDKSIVNYKANPKVDVLVNRMTKYLTKALPDCDMPPLGKYYLIHLDDGKIIICLPLGEYEWGITVDLTKVTLGLLLNVTLPRILASFEEAAAS
jgi:CheY-like chemotaxis protein